MYVRVCVSVSVSACACVCASVRVCARVRVCVCTCIRANVCVGERSQHQVFLYCTIYTFIFLYSISDTYAGISFVWFCSAVQFLQKQLHICVRAYVHCDQN